jgi:hypothetical protein
MNQIPTRGLFLTCTRNFFFNQAHRNTNYNNTYVGTCLRMKEKPPLVGMAVSSLWWQIPSLASPLLEANCPLRNPLPQPLCAYFHWHNILYIQTTLTCPLPLDWAQPWCTYIILLLTMMHILYMPTYKSYYYLQRCRYMHTYISYYCLQLCPSIILLPAVVNM